MTDEIAKKAAAQAAVSFIEEGMIIGLGTGSTATFFIEFLGKRCKEGLKIKSIATSKRSEQKAKECGIPIIDVNHLNSIDIAIDGADEIDPQKQMIKGGGGALLREKIVASMAKEMIVLVDAHKCVEKLGKFPLALEIVSFAVEATLFKLKEFNPTLRLDKQKPFKTDNGNFIIDLHFNHFIDNPIALNQSLHLIPGVIETGLFLNLAGRVVVGYSDGKVEIRR